MKKDRTLQQEARRQMMLNEPIGSVIFKMAIPTIVAFLITSIYNLADTYFVSGLGTNATAAVSVNASLDQLIMMCGSMLAVGANSYIARLLGQGNDKKASQVLSTSFILAFSIGALLLIFGSIALIVLDLRDFYGTMEETIRHAAFQVGSIITTTGYATTDFDLWPSFSKTILLCLMVVGACAGSTGGGLKVARLLLLLKGVRRNILQMMHPRKVQVVRNNGTVVNEKILDNTNAYLATYVLILFVIFAIISLDGFSVGTNFSAVLCTFNNIGPGLEAVGPTCNFSQYSDLSKLVLSWAMLAGRLEIFPMLILFSNRTWKKR